MKAFKNLLMWNVVLICLYLCIFFIGTAWASDPMVAAGQKITLGLKTDGNVLAVGSNSSGQLEASSWENIEQVAAGGWLKTLSVGEKISHAAGLRTDGNVLAVGSNSSGQLEVYSWEDIDQIAAGGSHTVGLKSNGSVVAVGDERASSWKNIDQIAAGGSHTVGLKSDGSVVAVGGDWEGQLEVSSWENIDQIAAGGTHTVGLKSDGSVVAVGANDYGQLDVSYWNNIVQIAAGQDHTVGLKADGSVVATGHDYFDQCEVSSWEDIVQIAAGGHHTVGLKSDGSVLATGDNKYGQCDVSTWDLDSGQECDPPSSISLDVSTPTDQGKMELDWTGADNADEYIIYINGSSDVSLSNKTRYTYTAASNGEYSMYVQAVNDCGSTQSNTVARDVCLTPSNKPDINAPEKSETGNYTISWGNVDHAKTYKLLEDGTEIYSGSDTSYTVANKQEGNYTYLVQASACGDKIASDQIITQVSKPEIGRIVDVYGGQDTDGDGELDNFFPVSPNFALGWKFYVEIKNIDEKTRDFKVTIEENLGNGWHAGADDGGIVPQLDTTYNGANLEDVPPGETRKAKFAVNVDEDAKKELQPSIKLYTDQLNDKFCHKANPTFRTGTMETGEQVVDIREVKGGMTHAYNQEQTTKILYFDEKGQNASVAVKNNAQSAKDYIVQIEDMPGWDIKALNGVGENEGQVQLNLGAGEEKTAKFNIQYSGQNGDFIEKTNDCVKPSIVVKHAHQVSTRTLARAGNVVFVHDVQAPVGEVVDFPVVSRLAESEGDNEYTLLDFEYTFKDEVTNGMWVHNKYLSFDVYKREVLSKENASSPEWQKVYEDIHRRVVDIPHLREGKHYELKVVAKDPVGHKISRIPVLNAIPSLEHEQEKDLVKNSNGTVNIYADYYDKDGDKASTREDQPILLFYNGEKHVMSHSSGSPVEGARYVARTLDYTGNASYYFIYGDSRGSPLRRYPEENQDESSTSGSKGTFAGGNYWSSSAGDAIVQADGVQGKATNYKGGSVITYTNIDAPTGYTREVRQESYDVKTKSMEIYQNLKNENYALLSQTGGVFRIVGIDDPANEHSLSFDAEIRDMATYENRAYVLNNSQLVCLEIADNGQPREQWRSGVNNASQVAVNNKVAAIVQEESITLHYVKDGGLGSEQHRIENSSRKGILLFNDILFIAQENRVIPIDISDMDSTQHLSTVQISGTVTDLSKGGKDTIYVSLQDGTVLPLDVSGKENMTKREEIPPTRDLGIEDVNAIGLSGNKKLLFSNASAVVCHRDYLGGLNKEPLGWPDSGSNYVDHALDGNMLALVTRNSSGYKMNLYNLFQGLDQGQTNGTIVLDDSKQLKTVELHDNMAYVNFGDSLVPHDISDLGNIRRFPKISVASPITSLEAKGDKLLLGKENGNIEIRSILDPAYGIVKTDHLDISGSVSLLEVYNHDLYIGVNKGTDDSGEILVYDLQDEQVENSYSLQGVGKTCVAYNSSVVVGLDNKKVQRIAPAKDYVGKPIDFPGKIRDLKYKSGKIIVALGKNGLMQLPVNNLINLPKVTGVTSSNKPVRSKTWNWRANMEATFRYAINRNATWSFEDKPFNTRRKASISGKNGTWYLHVQAKDEAGRLSEVTTVSAVLDNKPPKAGDINLEPASKYSSNATFNVKSSGVAAYKYKLDDEGWSNATVGDKINVNFRYLPFGDHEIAIIGKDKAGNWQSRDNASKYIWSKVRQGDVNADGTVDLQDVILSLKAGISQNSTGGIKLGADVNRDDRIGMPEALYGLHKLETPNIYYIDSDGDGYGTSGKTRREYTKPEGYSSNRMDCNDSDASVYPGAEEKCWDGVDNDCDGNIDENCGKPEPGDTFTEPKTGMEFVYVKGGCYQMGCGSWSGDCDPLREQPVHKVCVDSFWMSKYEVSIDQYRKFLQDTEKTIGVDWEDDDCPIEKDDSYSLSGKRFGKNGTQPMVQLEWQGARNMAEWLSRISDMEFRLPTEAEWEYAARSRGKEQKYAGGGNPSSLAWYGGDSGSTHEVGGKEPNGLGIYDMSGNVWEWCSDWFSEEYYDNSPKNNPQGPSSGPGHVFRGGSWFSSSDWIRSTKRPYNYSMSYYIGMRLVRDASDPELKSTYYPDSDGDGYGDPDGAIEDFSKPEGYVANNKDCNDNDPDISPGANEICGDGLDNDCDGEVDENSCDPAPGTTWTEPNTGMEFVWVPEGCYQMGCVDSSNCDEHPHKVCVDGFWIGQYEVTQNEWRQLMGNNPSRFDYGTNYPVENVSWNDCQEFIDKLNSRSGHTFRLPTEAEWEYAARSGGKKQRYSGCDFKSSIVCSVNTVAWYSGNSNYQTHAVGTKEPNDLGIYDMSGNVREWCSDWYSVNYYYNSPKNNPQGPSSGSARVVRGGNWSGKDYMVITTVRRARGPDFSSDGVQGFRLLKTKKE